MKLLGVDTGGTFTDFVLLENRKLTVHKVLSTPQAPEKAILSGIKELGISLEGLKIIHGSTVATNAVLESKGVKTVYISNYGLKDVLLIGRQARRELYNLQPFETSHPVDPSLCFETGGRLAADGSVVEMLTSDEINTLVSRIENLNPKSIAINFLFSFLDPKFENQLKAALPKNLFVSCSSDILPEYKEYERGITTWLNAYVGPLVDKYLNMLADQVIPAKVSVMLSSGGTASAKLAANKAVNMLLSGPAGGLQAAKFVGEQIGQPKLLSLDMGGTSTDVALIDGDIKLSSESCIASLPVAVSMVDMHTIGAGGGSIATVDNGGLLQVGPQSAGANPGPACYQNGGTLATVTDANVVLGRLPALVNLGGSLEIDSNLAKEVITPIAEMLNSSLESAALGILGVANEHMAQALRVISIQKGVDPRQFTLISFGGAGGLHVCDLADALDITRAVVPYNAGVFSALGMLVAPVAREISVTHIDQLANMTIDNIEGIFTRLVADGMNEMRNEGVFDADVTVNKSVDLRYYGQSFTLNIPWIDIQQNIELFHATHEQRYGHKLEEAVELVNLRVSLKAPTESLNWKYSLEKSTIKPSFHVSLYAFGDQVPVWARDELRPGAQLHGPALIIESVTTTLLKPDWMAEVDDHGHLLLTRI